MPISGAGLTIPAPIFLRTAFIFISSVSATIDNMEKRSGKGALFIPAGLFLGIGLGLYLQSVAAWTLIGLGGGFFFFAVSETSENHRKDHRKREP